MNDDKKRFVTVSIRFIFANNYVSRDVYKADDKGLYYAHDYAGSKWCSYNDNVTVKYKDKEYPLNKDLINFIDQWIKEKYGPDDEYVDLDGILI